MIICQKNFLLGSTIFSEPDELFALSKAII